MIVLVTDEMGFKEDMYVLRRNWGESIRIIIKEEGLTIEQFVDRIAIATDVEIAAKTISRWMDVRRNDGLPGYEKMQAVAKTFGIPIANLLKNTAHDGKQLHVPVEDIYALERVIYQLEYSTDGDPAALNALRDVIASRAFARLVFRIFYMREQMPRPQKTDSKRLDEYLKDSERAAELRALVKDAAEKLVNDLTPLPPNVTDYVPEEQVKHHFKELEEIDEEDDSSRPWEEEDEWLPKKNCR